ncbi:hypothetical protein D3OALGA1CA_2816 [Olavius algarvensis associated proteobacterium Delta 3]|nr:hypothetical protein D3OALGA1CA_2816 [Olavius algarvensis associated proteobacterium Delta 3]CAB5163820.1 hypothetical protein D3OALGB2SA_5609 [Olavius algarvensis associated proteobacterium Delta 3]
MFKFRAIPARRIARFLLSRIDYCNVPRTKGIDDVFFFGRTGFSR